MQDDILYKYFTPREALKFAAKLKLGHFTNENFERKINELIEQLSL